MPEINEVDTLANKAEATVAAAAKVEEAKTEDGSIPAEGVAAVKEALLTEADTLIEQANTALENGTAEEAEKLRKAAEDKMKVAEGVAAEAEKVEETMQSLAKLRSQKVNTPVKSTQDARRRTPAASQYEADMNWARKNNADFTPPNWDKAIPAMTQRKNVLSAAGENMQEIAKYQREAFNIAAACQFNPALIAERLPVRMIQDITTATAGENATGTVSAYWIPEIWESDPAVHLGTMPSSLYDNIRRIPVTTNRGDVPTVTGSEFKAIAEATAPSDGDLTAGIIKYEIRKFGMKMEISDETLDDSGFDVGAQFVDSAQRAMRRFVSEKVIAGNGTSEPQGIIAGVTDTDNITTTAANTAITIADLINWFAGIDANYADAAIVATRRLQMARIATLSTAQGQQSIESNPFGQLFGTNVVMYDGTGFDADLGASKNVAALGDFNRGYYWFERTGMSIERIREGRIRELGNTSFVAHMRVDGKVALQEAFQLLKTGS